MIILGTCGGVYYVYRGDVLQIESPGHPGNYEQDLDCEWLLIGPRGHYLKFEFVEFDLPRAFNCSTTDYLQIDEVASPLALNVTGTYYSN